MMHGGDAAEQIVRLSLEGMEVAVRLTGSAAKNTAVLLAAALKEEGKTKGKARITSMIKSGKELKVFSIRNRDLKTFAEQAKRYGVLYCVLKDKEGKDPEASVDLIVRAEDAAKIQRIVERFELGKVDKAAIVSEVKGARAAKEKKVPSGKENEGRSGNGSGTTVFEEQQKKERPSVREKLDGFKKETEVRKEERRKEREEHFLSSVLEKFGQIPRGKE